MTGVKGLGRRGALVQMPDRPFHIGVSGDDRRFAASAPFGEGEWKYVDHGYHGYHGSEKIDEATRATDREESTEARKKARPMRRELGIGYPWYPCDPW